RLGGTKMSKSLGNLVFVHDLLKEWEAPAIRLAIIANHYRDSWDWHNGLMVDGAARLARWRAAGEGDGGLEDARRALDRDLDTPEALVAIDRAAAAGLGVSRAMALLGVL
ncbi:MAG: cysteine--tRNA ligase, partial [Actinomycetota bacterium]|nr:cysteine--tRNA ligase [Actinomycetota bacterium]